MRKQEPVVSKDQEGKKRYRPGDNDRERRPEKVRKECRRPERAETREAIRTNKIPPFPYTPGVWDGGRVLMF